MTYAIFMIIGATIIHIILHYNLEKNAQNYEDDIKFHLPEEEDQSP
jgi:hypothetical protein